MNLRKAPMVLRGPLPQALASIQGYVRKLSPAGRAAIFGALQDEWCSQCGTELNGCTCCQIAAKRAELRRSTPGQKSL